MNADECRYETSRTVERRRDQRTERHRRCRELPWWHPARWFCEVVNVVVDVWVEVEIVTRQLVCAAADAVEEVADAATRAGRAVLGAIDHLIGCVTGNRTGYWPIIATARRAVPSRPGSVAHARSLSLGLAGPSSPEPYNHDGVAVRAEIIGGDVRWFRDGVDQQALKPDADDIPPFAPASVSTARPQAVTYDMARLGTWSEPPDFDLIAGGGDRLFAKAAGRDDLFIAILAKPYRHELPGGRAIDLPQSFYKLDPECGVPTADPAALQVHVRVPGDDETHAATERFPLFRKAFEHPLDLMDVWFAPRIWHQVDCRPRKDSFPPPARYPTYGHVTYRTNNPLAPAKTLRSIKYRRVLDLGIGASHLHEQHDARFGGEADALSGQGGIFGELLAGTRQALFGSTAFEAAYRLANGPIEDYGGWVDGTCIYFQLVQLKDDAAIAAGDLRQAFAILWIDEQMSFTERWRVLHPFDRDFTAIFQPILGVITRTEHEFYPGAAFDPDRYWCPLLEGHARPASRMAVARQYVALTGIDPDSGADEVYTLHLAWPTMDKTWRRRALPQDARADPATLRLRDDATLLLQARRGDGKSSVAGFAYQRVLPADGQEAPSIAQRARQPRFAAPASGYTHPWQFAGAAAGAIADARFSHFGVHEPVDARIQFYEVAMEQAGGLGVAAIEAATWLDAKHSLVLKHERMNWTTVAAAIASLDFRLPSDWSVAAAVRAWRINRRNTRRLIRALLASRERRTHASAYHNPLRFRLRHRGELGWIMTHADRRDDKIIAFDDLPRHGVTLVDAADPRRAVTIGVGAHRRNQRDRHGADVMAEVDVVSPPQVREARVTVIEDAAGDVARLIIALELARPPSAAHPYPNYEAWTRSNIWRASLAAIDPVTGDVLPILSVERPAMTLAGTVLTAEVRPPGQTIGAHSLAALLAEPLRTAMFTSLWCVGPSGLAAQPDALSVAFARVT